MLKMGAATLWVVITYLLIGCQRAPVRRTGVIAIERVKIEGARVLSQLENGSSHGVSVRGVRSGSVVSVDPADAYIDCLSSSGATRFQHVGGSQFDDEASRIEVAPGTTQQFVADIDLSVDSKNSQCHLYLKLQDGTIIESEQFEP
jgi:hypothetical protein